MNKEYKEYKVKENGIEYDIKEYTNGSKHWYLNGERHRENGPAIECANGDKFWFFNGVEVNESDIISLMNKTFVDELFGDIDL